MDHKISSGVSRSLSKLLELLDLTWVERSIAAYRVSEPIGVNYDYAIWDRSIILGSPYMTSPTTDRGG